MPVLLPPLPELPGEAFVDVVTHPSLGNGLNDWSRYSKVGEFLVPGIVSMILVRGKSDLTARQIEEQKDALLSDFQIEEWVTGYNLKSKIRCLPTSSQQIAASPHEIREFFYAYAGALACTRGSDQLNSWMAKLLGWGVGTGSSSNGFVNPSPPSSQTMGSSPLPPSSQHFHSDPKYSYSYPCKTEEPNPRIPLFPPQFQFPPSPSLSTSTSTSHSPSMQSSKTCAMQLNEKAQKQGWRIDYVSTSIGPPHAPVWTVVAQVNGMEYGRAAGSDKKKAKESAAREALTILGP